MASNTNLAEHVVVQPEDTEKVQTVDRVYGRWGRQLDSAAGGMGGGTTGTLCPGTVAIVFCVLILLLEGLPLSGFAFFDCGANDGEPDDSWACWQAACMQGLNLLDAFLQAEC